MGRSVSYASGAVSVCYRTMDEDPDSFDMIKEDVVESSKSQWPSFYDVDKWLGREDHVCLENRFAYIGLSEYCGFVSVWLVPRDVDDSEVGLRDGWIASIKPRFEKFFGETGQGRHVF